MSLLSFALAAVIGVAHAGPVQDLAQAADGDLPAVARQEAFDRLVVLGATDTATVLTMARNPDGDTRQRWVAIRVLGHVGGDGAENALVGLLDDPQPAIRAAVVGALGELGKSRNTGAVAAKLSDPAIIVRAEAANALGMLRDPSAVDALGKAIDDKSNFHRGSPLWVRKHYVRALGEIGHKNGVRYLLRAMDDQDPEVQAETIPAFEKISGFSMAQGRTQEQEREAWRRWASAQVQ
ncbi:MAG: HEAT repeat domain-containing protein [Alphaproteobacteria bacterium]|nr:HEAT repeat domain-containing protein [Alphaproteobacteria bacterium]